MKIAIAFLLTCLPLLADSALFILPLPVSLPEYAVGVKPGDGEGYCVLNIIPGKSSAVVLVTRDKATLATIKTNLTATYIASPMDSTNSISKSDLTKCEAVGTRLKQLTDAKISAAQIGVEPMEEPIEETVEGKPK